METVTNKDSNLVEVNNNTIIALMHRGFLDNECESN